MAVKKRKTVKKKTVKKKTVRKKAVKRKTVKKKTVKRKTVKKKPVKRKTVKKVVRKKTITKKKGSPVAKRKRSYKKRSAPKRRGRPQWRKKNSVGEIVTNLAIGMVGAIGTAQLANRTNIANPKIKAAIPLVIGLGIVMSKWGRKDMASYLASGAMFMGGISLVKQFQPNLVEIAGDYPGDYIDYENQLALDDMSGTETIEGEYDDYDDYDDLGESVDIGDDTEDWESADTQMVM